MKINLRNGFNADTIHATVRMNQAEYKALRTYMHTKPGADVWFPYGTTLMKHGYGWYYLSPTNDKRAIDKMQFALKVLKAFLLEEEEKIEEEVKRLMPAYLNGIHVNSFSNAHCSGEFAYLGDRREASRDTPERREEPRHTVPGVLASPARLQSLAAKFANRRM